MRPVSGRIMISHPLNAGVATVDFKNEGYSSSVAKKDY
jgi:hypothetical protein